MNQNKRKRDDTMADSGNTPTGPFIAMFEGFRADLDAHHDRRERIIKASRDITASSKKIIFTLQRVRNVGQPLPPFVHKANAQYWDTIAKQYAHIAADLQALNAHRYPQITGGNQEFIEALSFQHYLERQSLISYEDAKEKVRELSQPKVEGSKDLGETKLEGEGDGKEKTAEGKEVDMEGSSKAGDSPVVPLTPEDYILGICDMTGELMRFSVTSMATNGKLPAGRAKATPTSKSDDQMDIDTPPSTASSQPRTVLDDLRAIRTQLEMFEAPYGPKWVSELETKKMPVLRECVDKVEKALYGLTVRGSERPKGWMPDVGSDRRAEVESY
jgi:predicted translin family RNA/ssDNA-binding protein